jgi:hypothetical protein
MRYAEIITEALPPFGPNMSHILDLRDPEAKPTDYKGTPEKTFVVLTKGDGAVIFYYGNDGNRYEWKDVLEKSREHMDRSIQNDVLDIRVYRNGYLINIYRDDASWSGKRNRYSDDLAAMAKALKDRGLATDTTPLWVGNWARNDPTSMGSVGKILSKPAMPTRLNLYHGTSTFRLAKIMREGLKPLDDGARVWSKEKGVPDHRNDSIYLTADLGQAEYYADKAVKVDRNRLSRPNYSEPWKTNPKAIDPETLTVDQMRSYLKTVWGGGHYDKILDDLADEAVKQRAKEVLRRQSAFDDDKPEKLAPVILQVTLGTADMKKLMADDDFLRSNPNATPEEWLRSLGNFGQVAYRGTIPPNRIRVMK